jgi:hypothetical protein
MVALQAFVDDSAADTGDRRLFLAGYIGTAIQWIAFSYAWDMELKKYPSIEYFKMSEAAGLDGEFKDWNASDRDDKVLALARIIQAHSPWFVYSSVSRSEYNKILAPVSPYPLRTPYFSCFWGVISLAGRVRQRFSPYGGPAIDFVFDEQGGTGDHAVLCYRWIKENESSPEIKNSLGRTPVFADDRDVVALQAADMLAWHLRRSYERPEEKLPVKEILMTEGAYIDIDANALNETARKLRRVPGYQFIRSRRSWRDMKGRIQASVDAGAPAPNVNFVLMRWLSAKRQIKEAINRWRYPRRHRP